MDLYHTRLPTLMTLPKTQCLPSSQSVLTVHRKNCEPLVLGPALAMDRVPGPVCFSWKFSSANFCPKMDSPPVPLFRVKSPPWTWESLGASTPRLTTGSVRGYDVDD